MQYECCYQCGLPLNANELSEHQCRQCKVQAPYFDETICLDRYQGILQDALHQFKYQKRLSYASGLADVWNHLLSTSLISTDAHYLMPVPLSVKKLHARGFNQSWELARKLRCNANLVKLPYTLKRHHHSEHQVGSSRDERYRSIQEMFYIDKEYRECLQNKIVIVFDDVMTSGATLNEIARILKDNQVSRVINWVLLRATKSS
jgi:ComF family protein